MPSKESQPEEVAPREEAGKKFGPKRHAEKQNQDDSMDFARQTLDIQRRNQWNALQKQQEQEKRELLKQQVAQIKQKCQREGHDADIIGLQSRFEGMMETHLDNLKSLKRVIDEMAEEHEK